MWPTNDLTLKAVAHWTLKGLTIFYQNSTKSVEKSVGSFFQGGEHGKCQYVPEIVSNVQIDEKKIGSVVMMRMVPFWYHFKMCTDL